MFVNPSLKSLILSLLVCFLRVAASVGMDCYVVLDAEQAHVVWVIAQTFHLVRVCCRLEGDDVVAVNARHDVPFCLALLAQSFGPLLHDGLSLCPPLVGQHPHVLRAQPLESFTTLPRTV